MWSFLFCDLSGEKKKPRARDLELKRCKEEEERSQASGGQASGCVRWRAGGTADNKRGSPRQEEELKQTKKNRKFFFFFLREKVICGRE